MSTHKQYRGRTLSSDWCDELKMKRLLAQVTGMPRPQPERSKAIVADAATAQSNQKGDDAAEYCKQGAKCHGYNRLTWRLCNTCVIVILPPQNTG